MSNILVIGANGFIGFHLIDLLLCEGHFVVGFSRSNSNLSFSQSYNFKFVQGDFVETKNLQDIMNEYEIDVVIHLISNSIPEIGTANVIKDINNDIIPTVKLLDCVVKSTVKKIIFVSSGGTVYGEMNKKLNVESDSLHPICNYGVAKSIIEHYLELYEFVHGVKSYTVRLANPYGYSLNKKQGIIPIIINRFLNNEEVCIYGNTIRDYIYIEDVTNFIGILLNYNGMFRTFNVGTGIGTSLYDLIDTISEVTEKKCNIRFYPDRRNCDVQKNILDISLARKELNWRPRVSLRDGILKTLHLIESGGQKNEE